jgi:hypothetical protein
MAKARGRLGHARAHPLALWAMPAHASGALSFAAEVDSDAMRADLIAVRRETMHSARASVWLRRAW